MKALIEMDEARILLDQQPTLDHAFIEEHTAGYAALYDDLRQRSWAELEQDSGLTRSQMEDLAHSYSKSRATIVCYGLGITQHKNGTENVQQLVNLLLLKGNIGKLGRGSARCAVILMCRAIVLWGSTKRRPKISCNALRRIFLSVFRANMVVPAWRVFGPSSGAMQKHSSAWVAIWRWRCPSRSVPLRR